MSGVHFNKVSGWKPYWLSYIIALKNFVIPLFMPFHFLPCERKKRVLSAKVYRLNLENFKKSERYLEEFALITQFSLIDISCYVICYDRWVVSEGHKNYYKDWSLMNSQPTFLFLTYLNSLWPYYQKHVTQIILNCTIH